MHSRLSSSYFSFRNIDFMTVTIELLADGVEKQIAHGVALV